MVEILISVISCCLGVIVGYLMHLKPDGELIINDDDPEKDLYSFMVYTPMDLLPKKKYLRIRVSHKKQGL